MEPARARPRLQLVRSDEAPPESAARALPVEPAVRPTLDDAEILAGVKRGDPSAAVAFHDRVRPQVDRTIGRLLGRRSSDHDDLAQTAMIAIVRSLDRFRGECSLDTWSSRVTAHTVFKEIRRRRVERRIFDRDVEPEGTLHRHPGDVVSDRSTLARIRRHLDAMDPVKAWTVVLHDVEGYDLREIAEITEASVAAAQTRLVRGRRELHERLLADPELASYLENRRGKS